MIYFKNAYHIIIFSLFMINCPSFANNHIPAHIIIKADRINDKKYKIQLTFFLHKKDFLYKDFISFSVAHPDVVVSPWQTHSPSITYYDPLFKSVKEILKNKVRISLTVTTDHCISDPVFLYCTYFQRGEKKIKQISCELLFSEFPQNHQSSINTLLETDVKQEKIKYMWNIPFNVYMVTLFSSVLEQFNIVSMPYCIHIMILLFVFILWGLSFYCFRKKYIFLREFYYVCISSNVVPSLLLVHYTLYVLYIYVSPALVTPLATPLIFTTGVLYLKKSTAFQSNCMRAFCNIYGGLCIVATMPLAFKTMQYVHCYVKT